MLNGILVQLLLLFSAQMDAEHVVLPVGEDTVSLLGLPNAEEDHLHHRRYRFGTQNISSDHGTTTQAQPR